jgi:hypothetical protein
LTTWSTRWLTSSSEKLFVGPLADEVTLSSDGVVAAAAGAGIIAGEGVGG